MAADSAIVAPTQDQVAPASLIGFFMGRRSLSHSAAAAVRLVESRPCELGTSTAKWSWLDGSRAQWGKMRRLQRRLIGGFRSQVPHAAMRVQLLPEEHFLQWFRIWIGGVIAVTVSTFHNRRHVLFPANRVGAVAENAHGLS